MPTEKRTIRTITTTEYRVSGREILSLIPGLLESDRIEVCFKVPGGGDYSGMELEIMECQPVIVRVTREERT